MQTILISHGSSGHSTNMEISHLNSISSSFRQYVCFPVRIIGRARRILLHPDLILFYNLFKSINHSNVNNIIINKINTLLGTATLL